MSGQTTIRALAPADRPQWIAMRCALWTNRTREELEQEIAGYESTGRIWDLPSQVLVADDGTGRLIGFLEVSLRPVADGCASSPVGYVEGWYVAPEARRQGVGRALANAVERWARERGCCEMASDCGSDNHLSHQTHLALGYQHAQSGIRFHKSLTNQIDKSRRDFTGLLPMQLSVELAVKLVTDPVAGGIDVFLGTTRSETDADGRALVALDYEAYEAMAEEQMRGLAKSVRERYPVIKLAILHRTGRVELGEPSVIIAVSTPHRAEAFEACRWIIDALKKDVAIWKKEVWSDGASTWVHPD
jgi:molybdopterin synthase catalytic subunit/GNAT superfamily N-acetyltransferase